MAAKTTTHPDNPPAVLDDLCRCALFADVSFDAVQRDCTTAKIRSFVHGSTIYSQGEHCSDVYCVLGGQIKLARVSQAGDEFTTGLRTTGELFGALDGTDSSNAQDTATAKGSVTLWSAPYGEFRNLMLHQPVFGLHVVEALARRQRQMERRLECFALKKTETRLVETLRELSGGFEARCEHGFGQHIRLTQQELADLVGASRQVTSTILNNLRGKGVLGYNREYVCVRDIDAVERLMSD
jgi:CRP-like cAMP-binding protein